MIYELKIELFGGKVPVTRILHVNSETSFKQLHYVIQTAFDWSGLRPHIFLLHEKDKVQAFIKLEEINQPALEYFREWHLFEEKNHQIATFLNEIGDSMVYEYYQNYQKRRYHMIELVNITEPEPGRIYPYCAGAEYLSPKEAYPSRISTIRPSLNSNNVCSLTEQINQLLLEEAIIISEPLVDKNDYYQKKLQKTAIDFLYQRSWKILAEDQIFSVIDHDTGIQLFCSVSGSDRDDPGLSIFVGGTSFIELQNSSKFYHKTNNAMQTLNQLQDFYGMGIVFKDQKHFPPSMLDMVSQFKELRDHHPLETSKDLAPIYFSYKSNERSTEKLTSKEMRWLILCLEQVREVSDLVKKGLLVPSISGSNTLLERVYSLIYQQFVNQEIYLTRR